MPRRPQPPERHRPTPARRRRPVAGPRRWFALPFRFGAFALLWIVLTGNGPGAWPFGAVAAAAAAAASWALMPPRGPRWRCGALLRFVPLFLWRSLRGGLDVAGRALHPGLPIAPALAVHRLRLPAGPPRVMLTDVVSLLPGTLAAGSDDDRVRIHWLDRGPRSDEMIDAEERRVAAVFGLEPPADGRRRGARDG
ncbi:MAG TPA: Na+/H+ antiporter subunit E [Geminicoccaceae bacterium]|nr:Na+/H+ antiporter subunit E [Geminicoccaceae bacterium]